jgi:hypothetical protein
MISAFSRSFEKCCHALALVLFFDNFRRVQKAPGVTAVMAAGVVESILKMEDCVSVIDAGKRRKRCPHRRREAVEISG